MRGLSSRGFLQDSKNFTANRPQGRFQVMKKFLPYLVIAGVAIVSVYIYNNYIATKLVTPTA